MEVIFTKHALLRIKKRKITKEEIVVSIKSPDKTYKRKGKFYVQKNIGRANIEIIYEKDKYIRIITLYYL
ncbi:DUF4258 domain-containing protein [Candidatus Pacearchaeota archaeon]|nr:DUF4258 domain-containing protein [Candidatus Pacearchaeota archaeon]